MLRYFLLDGLILHGREAIMQENHQLLGAEHCFSDPHYVID